MATAPTVTKLYEVPSWTATTSPRTSSSLTVAAGDVLVVLAAGSSSNGALSVSDSASLTWSGTSVTTSGYTPVYLWTATVVTAGSLTVTVTRASGSSYYGFVVLKAASCGGVGTPVTGSGTSGGPSLAITTTTDNSAIAYISGDYNSVSVTSRAWRQVNSVNPTEDYVGTPSSSLYIAHYGDAGTANSKTAGLSAPTGQKWSVVAVELKPTARVTKTLDVSWNVRVRQAKTLAVSWNVKLTRWVKALATAWNVRVRTRKSLVTSWNVLTHANWRDAIRAPAFRAALLDPHREISAIAELVTLDGEPAQWVDDQGPLDPALVQADIEMAGEIPEQWSLRSATIMDPRWVPRDPTHPLGAWSRLAIKLWWRLKVGSQWVAIPLGVYKPTDVRIHDEGIVSVSFTGRDLLSVAMDGGYGGQVIDVGGLTVDAALRKLFATVAPALKFRAPISTVTLPAVYQLGAGKPFDDWTAIAELAGWRVRTDRDGIVTAGPAPTPSTVSLVLREGPDCLVTRLDRTLSSVTYNRVTVIGTGPDLTAPVFGKAEDTNPASPSWIGLGVIRQLVIESDAPTDNTAADNMAAAKLGQFLRPAETVVVEIPQNPTLSYRDLVQMARAQAGVAGDYQVSKWAMSVPLPGVAPKPMEVTMMSRQT